MSYTQKNHILKLLPILGGGGLDNFSPGSKLVKTGRVSAQLEKGGAFERWLLSKWLFLLRLDTFFLLFHPKALNESNSAEPRQRAFMLFIIFQKGLVLEGKSLGEKKPNSGVEPTDMTSF